MLLVCLPVRRREDTRVVLQGGVFVWSLQQGGAHQVIQSDG